MIVLPSEFFHFSMESDDDDVDSTFTLDPFDRASCAEWLITKFKIKTINSKGKSVKRTTIPKLFSYHLLLNTRNPCECIFQIAEILPSYYIDEERLIMKAFQPIVAFLFGNGNTFPPPLGKYKYYETVDRFVQETTKMQYALKMELKRLLSSNSHSPWICYFISCANFNLTCIESNPIGFIESETQMLLNRILQARGFVEVGYLISTYSLHHLIDLNSFLYLLVQKNDVATLQQVLFPSHVHYFLNLLEQRLGLEFEMDPLKTKGDDIFRNTSKLCIRFAKVADIALVQYPFILLGSLVGSIRWSQTLLKKLDKVGNVNYDFSMIQDTLLFRLLDMSIVLPESATWKEKTIYPKRMLEKIIEHELRASSLDMLWKSFLNRHTAISKSATKDGEFQFQIKADPDHYTATSRIVVVNSEYSTQKLKELIPNITMIGLDCEWSTDRLAIAQLCCQFRDGSRATYVIDTLELKPDVLYDLFTPLFESVEFVGFDMNQDVSRLVSYCKLFLEPRVVHDIKQYRHDGCNSLDDYVRLHLSLKLDKRPRLGFWEHRPLLPVQILYAASDAEVLLDLHAKINL